MNYKQFKLLLLTVAMICSYGLVMAGSNGLNLPPTQGSTNAGAFMPGIYSYAYTNNDVAGVVNKNFSHLRIPINVDTANDPASLNKIEGYFAQVGYNGVICMFDTLEAGETDHGNGRPNNHWAMALAWRAIHQKFQNYPNIKYEIFNEPFGYGINAIWYMDDMNYIMANGQLPSGKCILSGLGYSDNVQAIRYLWSGDLSYHFYPTWVQTPWATQENFSNTFQSALAGVASRTHVTEFGSNLMLGDVYNTYIDGSTGVGQDINCLRGMHDAVAALRNAGTPVKSTYYWHGWNNGDCYDIWSSASAHGAEKVINIQKDSGGYYYIVNKNSGKAAAVLGASSSDGGDIVQWYNTGANHFQWKLIDAGNGYYKIQNRNSGKYWAVYQASMSDGGDIVQWSDYPADNFLWQIVSTGDVGSGYFRIVNKNSGKCAAVYGASTSDGGDIVQWSDYPADNFEWRIISAQ